MFDGDLCLVLNNKTMMAGVDRNAPIVIDVEDKATAMVEHDTKDNRIALVMRTMKSLIGEYSNYSSAYHNKCPHSAEQKNKYEKYIDQISVLTGKAIDQAKTGIFYKMPAYIAKYGRPLPYFMKYRKPYYARQKLSKAQSNMNRLCVDVEKWHRSMRWKRVTDFDYTVMIDDDVADAPDDVVSQIRELYLAYNKEMTELRAEQKRVRSYVDDDIRDSLSKFDAQNYVINWDFYYDKYKNLCAKSCPDQKMLANIVVRLQYEEYPKSDSRFMWVVAEEGILANIKQRDDVMLPHKDPFGKLVYLGKRYSLVPMATEQTENFDAYEDWIGEWQFD